MKPVVLVLVTVGILSGLMVAWTLNYEGPKPIPDTWGIKVCFPTSQWDGYSVVASKDPNQMFPTSDSNCMTVLHCGSPNDTQLATLFTMAKGQGIPFAYLHMMSSEYDSSPCVNKHMEQSPNLNHWPFIPTYDTSQPTSPATQSQDVSHFNAYPNWLKVETKSTTSCVYLPDQIKP